MVILEFRLVGKPRQYAALDEAIRTTQFIRNKCVHYWQDRRDVTPYDLSKYCAVLACEYAFVRKLNAIAGGGGAGECRHHALLQELSCEETGQEGVPTVPEGLPLGGVQDHRVEAR
jgi:hypothetical protein